jgi:hypothetical protein
MNTIQKKSKLNKKWTYFDVVRTLDEGLAVSSMLLASDPYQLDAAIWAVHEWGQRRALDAHRAGAGRRPSPKLAATHLGNSTRASMAR